MDEEERYLLNAYRIIARERPQALGGIAGIPLSAVERFLRFWPEFDEVRFVEEILAIDEAFRDGENERREREGKFKP